MWTFMHIYIHMHIYIYMHMYTYVHTYVLSDEPNIQSIYSCRDTFKSLSIFELLVNIATKNVVAWYAHL